MRKYITEYDSALIRKNEREIVGDFKISEDFNQRMWEICGRKRRNTSKMRKMASAAAIIVLTVVGAGAVTNAATDGKVVELLAGVLEADVVTNENRELIGTEVIGNDEVVIVHEDMTDYEDEVDLERGAQEEQLLKESHIIRSIDEELLLPFSIEEFEVTDGKTPEIIMTNGAAAVFYQRDYEGWKCDAEDKIVFDFSKYESEVTEEQTLVVGYVLDGVMHNFEETFKALEGRYELQVEDAGEYYIYLISATSDYLTIKEGEIWVE